MICQEKAVSLVRGNSLPSSGQKMSTTTCVFRRFAVVLSWLLRLL